MATDIPLIDIAGFSNGDSTARRAVTIAWTRAFSTIGFASILGHGIAESLLTNLYAEARNFFDQPRAVKMRFHDPAFAGRGYTPAGVEAVARSMGVDAPSDLCEALQFVNVHLGEAQPLGWPTELPGLRVAVEAFAHAASGLGRQLMRISAVALELPEDYFENSYDRMAASVRLVEYPDQPDEPRPGQLRNAAHTDFGGFTILRQDDAPGGLQVKDPDGDWTDVRPTAGTLVINAGDLIERWTNGRWRSNVHRVVNPPRRLTGSTRRLSIVGFTGPNPDAVVACLPTCRDRDGTEQFPPITASEHVRRRLRLSYGLDET